MKIAARLLSYISRVLDKDPHEFLALRLRYAGGTMRWRVEDATLYTFVNGGSGVNLTVDLTQYTVSALAYFLAAQPGYSVVYLDASENASLGARLLIDSEGNQDESNGDHITGYTNVLWSWLEALASELRAVEQQIANMLLQLSTKTASDVWLDDLGDEYGIPRLAGESDGSYGPRIISEVLRPRTNNVGIEQAIKAFTGQDVIVSDVVIYPTTFPRYDGVTTHNGANTYNSTARPVYGLFDVQYGYDLENGGSFAQLQTTIQQMLERLRAAGTQLRSLSLTGSRLADVFPSAPTDAADMPLVVGTPGLSDAATAPGDSSLDMTSEMAQMVDAFGYGSDQITLTITPNFSYNGVRVYDGLFPHVGTTPYVEVF